MNRTLHLSRPGREPASESSDSGEPRLIGGEIRGLRKARGLTLTDLADASGLSIGYLSLLERDSRDAVDQGTARGVARARRHHQLVLRGE